MSAPAVNDAPPAPLPRAHATRLRHYWRSQGWACHDNIDIDLLRWGLVIERGDDDAASCLALTDAGRGALGDGLKRNRAARDAHSRATEAVAARLAAAGRLVFTELSVRTEHEGRWRSCKPDVFSLVRGLRADHLAPQVHEIKVKRADLLGELRGGKIERYRELAAAIYLVIADGIADPDEIPADYGVGLVSAEAGFRIARTAPIGDYALETRHWMALAKATPFTHEPMNPQLSL
ncbi:hypothetical protein [Salinisphaera hydrothermalis]|uniref:Uncharacterized protein n=1 Tax=Salinisphaera hydrothermalis (strain C41B8) TaxID=1304275 RepID=A0A084IQM3_SALHC|nr:hypothetical protein [Salinisphaera hydrothermalis]KEZ79007.1 hypothetical protein C41B8_02717 [Salinisphaera hydrothermalis C41B8]